MHNFAWNRRQFLSSSALAAMALPLPRTFAQMAITRPASPAGTVDLRTPLGTLRGEVAGNVHIFRGVPFAEPPVGDLRFRPPQPARPWTGTRDATQFSAASVQPGDQNVPQSEDCFYLNVWTPATRAGQGPKPVFVWIHGGGFTGGEAFAPIFDGTVFARQNVVLVTVAYRLGVLGFLDVSPLLGASYAGSANNALRDLLAALAWVQANIAAFGGDPEQVTVGGESAGAKLTDILAGTPSARPLFHGMISESGGAERIWAKADSERIAEGFGRQWMASAPGRSFADLRTAPARTLIEVQDSFTEVWPQHFPLRCEIDGALIPRLPIQTIAAGNVRGKRLLIGTNRDESALFLGAHPQQDPTANQLGNMTLADFDHVFAQYATLYPEMSAEQRRIRALTAEEYWVPSVRVADAAAGAGAQVWAYELEFARSGGRFANEAYHSEDIGLVWDKPEDRYSTAAAEARLAHQMNVAWAAFLRGGPPAASGLPRWTEYNRSTRATMLLDSVSRMQDQPQAAELKLWNGRLEAPPGETAG